MPRHRTKSFARIIALSHQLCSELYYSHFIDEDAEGQRVAACLGMHSWYMTVLGSNLGLSDVEVQLFTITLSCSVFSEELL